MDPVKNMCKPCLPTRKNAKRGFGIVEVMVSIVVLGFMYVALSKLQGGNHDAFIRIRGRDGAIQVAQELLDSLKSVGVKAIPSKVDADTILPKTQVSRSWERGLGGTSTVTFWRTVTVLKTEGYSTLDSSNYENINDVYAKQVNVSVEWNFKGSTQSVSISGVVR